MSEFSDRRSQAVRDANKTMEKVKDQVEKAVQDGASDINVIKVLKTAGADITPAELARIRVPECVEVYTFVPWYTWFPWRPLVAYLTAKQMPVNPSTFALHAGESGRPGEEPALTARPTGGIQRPADLDGLLGRLADAQPTF